MKFLAQVSIIVFAVGLMNSDVYAQRRTAAADMRRLENERRERELRETQLMFEVMANNKRVSSNSTDRSRLPALKMSSIDKKRLEPSIDLTTKHSAFLKMPKTGLFHLLPDSGCNLFEQVLTVDEKCRSNTIPGGGAFYSFRRDKHVFPVYADIQLKDNNLTVAGAMMQSILVSLGPTELDKINLTSGGMETLVNFVPSNSFDEANKQAEQFQHGFIQGRYKYVRALPIDENTVYAARLIAYRPDKDSIIRTPTANGTYAPHPFELDKREDIIVVYRIVQKDADGSVWLLWRELAQKKSPILDMGNSNKNQK
jgi:hypothetical protein